MCLHEEKSIVNRVLLIVYGDRAEICNQAPRYQSFASTGLIIGIIMLALGIVLIIIGVLKEGTPKIRRET